MLRTIAVSNEKGGVAKTTTTLSLGAALAESGSRVLVIDLDAQANLTLALGFEPGEAQQTSSHIMLDNLPLQNACRKTEVTQPGSDRFQFAASKHPSSTCRCAPITRPSFSAPSTNA
jgi:cellulose biosynthesis protein BcsQ